MTENSEQIATTLNPWEIMATLGAAVMEVSWVVLLYQAMGPAPASDPIWMPFSFFLAGMVVVGLVARVVSQLGLSKGVDQAVLVVILGLSYWIGSNLLLQAADESGLLRSSLTRVGNVSEAIPGEVWLALALIWLVFRGYVYGRQGVGRFAVFSFFRLGIGMFLVYGLLSLSGSRDLPGIGMFSLFLFATLMAMAASRVSFLGRIRGGRRNPFTRQWLGSISGAVVSAVGTGLLVAMLVIGRLQTLILFIIGAFLTLVFTPVLLLLGLLIHVPVPEMALPSATPEASLAPGEFNPDTLNQALEPVKALPANLQGYVIMAGIVLGLVVLALMLWAVTSSVRRLVGNPEVEYIAQRGDLVEMLRKQAGDQLRQPGDWLANRLGKRQRVQAATRIRQLYVDLLTLSDTLSIPRLEVQTPLEFLPTLQNNLPTVQEPLTLITQAYLKVRYGEMPETREEILAVESAWEQVQRAGEAYRPILQAHKQAEENLRLTGKPR
jgi:hypothetical protein